VTSALASLFDAALTIERIEDFVAQLSPATR
jgi:hypothetical protein